MKNILVRKDVNSEGYVCVNPTDTHRFISQVIPLSVILKGTDEVILHAVPVKQPHTKYLFPCWGCVFFKNRHRLLNVCSGYLCHSGMIYVDAEALMEGL